MNEIYRKLIIFGILMTILVCGVTLVRRVQHKPKPTTPTGMGPGWMCAQSHNEAISDPEDYNLYGFSPVKQVSVCDQWVKK